MGLFDRVDLLAKVGDIVLDDRELAGARALGSLDLFDLRLDLGQPRVELGHVVLGGVRRRLRGVVYLVAQLGELSLGCGVVLDAKRQDDGDDAGGQRQHGGCAERVEACRELAVELGDPRVDALELLRGIGRRGGLLRGLDLRLGRWWRSCLHQIGLGPATSPSAGSRGNSCSTHAAIPPVMLCASKPAWENASAAIAERLPPRQ